MFALTYQHVYYSNNLLAVKLINSRDAITAALLTEGRRRETYTKDYKALASLRTAILQAKITAVEIQDADYNYTIQVQGVAPVLELLESKESYIRGNSSACVFNLGGRAVAMVTGGITQDDVLAGGDNFNLDRLMDVTYATPIERLLEDTEDCRLLLEII
ncbi:hypothetical protein CH63R_14514 [Colletotrichum higginsianum IMI 349063]|uniref:Uncharacterized protein n=1 Tax=Colletotrichum higginsianum (strain IMI 349063) TaxID=759273 RepID=A0A1B7XR19_COLHI|nr:hypothetical protein CH63R_14514 [Colletotrichum higginsianum IMI 349063]OBR02213.1 hypothetical protein CH63R_14514 [Colletotrichum higginsianum IMI 349063]